MHSSADEIVDAEDESCGIIYALEGIWFLAQGLIELIMIIEGERIDGVMTRYLFIIFFLHTQLTG